MGSCNRFFAIFILVFSNCVRSCCRVQLTDDGKSAIHRFSSGDMRVAINLLQSASMSAQVVDEASIYACTGYPNPNEMKRLLESCLNDPLTAAFKSACCLGDIVTHSNDSYSKRSDSYLF